MCDWTIERQTDGPRVKCSTERECCTGAHREVLSIQRVEIEYLFSFIQRERLTLTVNEYVYNTGIHR